MKESEKKRKRDLEEKTSNGIRTPQKRKNVKEKKKQLKSLDKSEVIFKEIEEEANTPNIEGTIPEILGEIELGKPAERFGRTISELNKAFERFGRLVSAFKITFPNDLFEKHKEIAANLQLALGELSKSVGFNWEEVETEEEAKQLVIETDEKEVEKEIEKVDIEKEREKDITENKQIFLDLMRKIERYQIQIETLQTSVEDQHKIIDKFRKDVNAKIQEIEIEIAEKQKTKIKGNIPEISESENTEKEKESIDGIKWLRKRGNKLLIYIIAKLMIEGFIDKHFGEDFDNLVFTHFRCLDGSRFNKKSLASERKEMISFTGGMTVEKPPRGGDELEELIEHLKKIAALLEDN